MKVQRNHLLRTLSFGLWFGAVAACGGRTSQGGGDGHRHDGDRPGPAPPGDLGAEPAAVYTGFDGVHTFQVPMSAAGGGLTWSIHDATIAKLEPDPASFDRAFDRALDPAHGGADERGAVVVTALAPGTTEVTVAAGRATATRTLVVQRYTAASYAIGERRYNTLGDAGERRAACASCHGLTNGVDQSPASLSLHTDDDLLSAITTGRYQSGRALRGADHAMNLTDAEKQGIVPYLRALSPRS